MKTNNHDLSDRLETLSDGRRGLRSQVHVEIKADANAPIIQFVASDETIDRYDEVIQASGWKLDNYQKNPVFQNAHQYGDIIHTLGRAVSTRVSDGRLVQKVEFAVDANPIAKIAYQLYKGRFLNAVSVGFVPLVWEDGGSLDNYRRKFTQQELLEVSAVGIPANPNALVMGIKSGAVSRSDLRELGELIRAIEAGQKITRIDARSRRRGDISELIRLGREVCSL
jgi:HK97 family phage prohead protease